MAETLTITSIGHEGDGIAETTSGRVYVPFTLPGETVAVEIEGERGHLVDIVTPSPERTAPACRHFTVCGGCTIQHWAAEPYQDWKRGLVATAFQQRGIETEIAPIVPVGPHTRRRAVFSLIKTDSGTVLGFHRRESHDVLAIEECPLLVPEIETRRERLAHLADRLLERGKRGRMTVIATDNGLDVALDEVKTPSRADYEALGRHSTDGIVARLTVNGAQIFMSRVPEIRTDAALLYPTPSGFLQATAPSETALARLVDAAVGKATPVADLFSGIGTFTLRLARRAPVLAVEGDTILLQALDRSMRFSKGIKTITARRRDLFVNPMAPPELKPFGAVVFDPPRAGAKAQSEMLAKSTVPKIVAVSCNPATLARDARILIDGGYRLTRVTPVDQFLWSGHVEVVAEFELARKSGPTARPVRLS
ncbi:class I SAM-dependent RNA methyltransferase [Kaistia dalseonensis]|uniref:23S rRNA (Uracil1939-C5)-methyltransferase n=1 Tax=Kaistia dalseonensis TaxID=410840 RepID=A0ABU0HDJ3_9HYPH|nr:class I SAM-dependent RNA methyltransferase [Kaistia dalseonensis]MCX5497383.1 class I SAM-dependent RNA methyltransferase [Kaistia dalseonensis]MDQ0440022.1 23S rRNA (uracil1939-C5)-methyltransferase [Kaistia dalseonensis]